MRHHMRDVLTVLAHLGVALWVMSVPLTVHAYPPDSSCIPPWVAFGVGFESDSLLISGTSQADGDGCAAIYSLAGTSDIWALHFDSSRAVTQAFVGDYQNDRILCYEINVALDTEIVELPLAYGDPWLAKDLDQDGNIELVVQRGDPGFGGNGYLDIHSAPDWRLRSRIVLPGRKVYMNPAPTNVDEDDDWELYITPSSLGGTSFAAIVDLNRATGEFEILSSVAAPSSTSGRAAVGDFDHDGRVEFLSGNRRGYSLFEYTAAGLAYIGPVVDDGFTSNNFYACTSQPKPGDTLFALLGHSSGGTHFGWRYQLYKALNDNQFSLNYEFQEFTGWSGRPECSSVDLDGDGVEEIMTDMYPTIHIWSWNRSIDDFIEICDVSETEHGSILFTSALDLNQDSYDEFAGINHRNELLAFKQSSVIGCETPPKSLMAWWPFDEESVGLAEEIWARHDGFEAGAVEPTAGVVGMGLRFNPPVSLVWVPEGSALQTGGGDFSVALWMETSGHPAVNPLASHLDATMTHGWAMWIGSDDMLRVELADGIPTVYASPPVPELSDGSWHHLAVTVDRDAGDGLRYYRDGVLIGASDPTASGGDLSSSGTLLLGAMDAAPGARVCFTGALDEVQVFSQALDSMAVRRMFEAGGLGQCKPILLCNCDHQADVTGDGYVDATDVWGFIQYILFNGSAPNRDLNCPHANRGDLNCDLFDDILDLNFLVDVVYYAGVLPCQPCL